MSGSSPPEQSRSDTSGLKDPSKPKPSSLHRVYDLEIWRVVKSEEGTSPPPKKMHPIRGTISIFIPEQVDGVSLNRQPCGYLCSASLWVSRDLARDLDKMSDGWRKGPMFRAAVRSDSLEFGYSQAERSLRLQLTYRFAGRSANFEDLKRKYPEWDPAMALDMMLPTREDHSKTTKGKFLNEKGEATEKEFEAVVTRKKDMECKCSALSSVKEGDILVSSDFQGEYVPFITPALEFR